jgi:DNA-binding LytR/AlgR family response regulator
LIKSYFKYENWNLGKMLLKVVLIIATVGTLNFLYELFFIAIHRIDVALTSLFLMKSFIRMVLYTVIVGSLPSIILILLIERFLSLKNQTIADEVTQRVPQVEDVKIPRKIVIPSNNKNEQLTIEKSQLICIKAEGNYVNVFLRVGNEIKSQLLRNTLANIIAQIEDKSIKRSHLSYIVNFDNVKDAYGNAQNTILKIEGLRFDIPVSRKFSVSSILNADMVAQ